MDSTWSPTPGQPVVLSLDPQAGGLSVRIVPRTVAAAHETKLQKFIYTPRLWASTIAGLAICLLLSSAFATGAIRPAPPRAPTPAPGEPTPTPDTRPALSFGGFQLVAPVLAPTATPARAGAVPLDGLADQPTPAQAQAQAQADQADEAPDDLGPAPTPAPACTNLFGIGCGSPPPPSRVQQPVRAVQPVGRPVPPRAPSSPGASQPGAPEPQDPRPATGVIPVGSPVPFSGDAAGSDLASRAVGPPPGSNLDLALKVASIASDQFNRSLEDPVTQPRAPDPTPTVTPLDSPAAGSTSD